MRYINLCRNAPKRSDPVKEDDLEPPVPKYEKYKETYAVYNNTEKRKDFMKEYNRNYRLQHSNLITCGCGVTYKDISKYAHARSKGHILYTQKLQSAE